MAIMRTGSAGLAAMLAVLVFASPVPALANETREEAGRCAVRYLQVNHSTNASRIIAGYDTIDLRDRAWQLIRVHELAPAISTGSSTFAEDLNNFVGGQASYLQLGRMRDITLLPELPLQADIDSGDTDLQESAVSRLADCDRTFGFAPVIALAPVLSDFDCAVAYWLRGAMYPMDQAAAGERAQFALGRYQSENAGLSVEEIIGQVQASGNARYERIMQESRDLEEFRKEMIAEGQNPDEAAFTERLQRRAVEALSFQRDIVACEAKYSFGQAGGQ